MRQVNRDELIFKIVTALGHVRAADWKAMTDHRPAVKDRALVTIATRAADALNRLEVLTDAPPAPETVFSTPLARMTGAGGSGAPVLD